MVKTIYSA
jgi:signal transduction histidine kinase